MIVPDSTHLQPLCHGVLLTDLYELTMAAAYFDEGFDARASFELFIRALPHDRGYLLAAGLEQALEFLEQLRFDAGDIDYLRRHPMFAHVPQAFFESLRDFRFTGDVWAMPEGTPVFGNEPLLRVTAPIIEAQIVETYLLATISFQTMIATKAARMAEAAQGRDVVEFGTRRAHGPEAGVLAARAAYIGGCVGTSNVDAGLRFGIPTYGTIAHSFIMAHEHEDEAFARFERLFPEHSILLIDTYDTLRAVERIVAMGLHPRGVRLDSGNIAELSKEVRARLDEAGLGDTKILASGDLDEFRVTRLLAQQAPIDIFAVGTALVTSKDAPTLSAVYKLVETEHAGQVRYAVKFSEDKATYPGCKQVFRFLQDGRYDYDLIARADEQHPAAEPLLQCAMRDGKREASGKAPSLVDVRKRAKENMDRLPAHVRELKNAAEYPVRISDALQQLLNKEKAAGH
jgi:nicotinate phosphoribosyltransferase